MSEETKYSVVGRVEIGTDEYRDLIEKCMRLEKESSENRSLYWKEQTKASDNFKKVTALQKQLDEYKAFVVDCGLEKQLKEYKISKLDEEQEEN